MLKGLVMMDVLHEISIQRWTIFLSAEEEEMFDEGYIFRCTNYSGWRGGGGLNLINLISDCDMLQG